MSRRGGPPQSLREYVHPPTGRLSWLEWLVIAGVMAILLIVLNPGWWPDWLFQLPYYAICAGLLAAVVSVAAVALQGLLWLLRRIRRRGDSR